MHSIFTIIRLKFRGSILRFITHPKSSIIKVINLLFYSKEYKIIYDPETIFPILYKIKDKTWDRVNIPEVFEIRKSGVVFFRHPAQYILNVSNGTVSLHSDAVITDKGVIWDKIQFDVFTRQEPHDLGMITYNKHYIRLIKNKTKINLSSPCLSLLGMCDGAWSHFLIQYMPKLHFAAEAGLLSKKMVVLAPCTMDNHTKNSIDIFLENYPLAELRIAELGEEYICEVLYHMPMPTLIGGYTEYLNLMDQMLPERARIALNKHMVLPLKEKSKNQCILNKRIYLIRRDYNRRIMINWKEVESYFERLGFLCIEPHKFSLLEKIAIFSNADIVVGPFSSAFSNVLFCKKDVKIMCLSSFPFALGDGFISNLADTVGINKILFVTGEDTEINQIQTNYHIPLLKVISAYKYLIDNY